MYHRLPVRSTKMQWDYDMYLPQRMGKNSSHCAQVFAVQAFNPQTQMSPKDSLSPLTRVKLSIKAALWSFWVDFRFPGFWVTFSEAKLIGSWVEVHIVCFEFKLILINPCKLWNWGRLLKKYKREIKLFSPSLTYCTFSHQLWQRYLMAELLKQNIYLLVVNESCWQVF